MSDLFAALDRTWPAARTFPAGGWTVRQGLGGGRRVSAATAHDESAIDTIAAAEAAQQAMGQSAVFAIRPDDGALDDVLAGRGYRKGATVTMFEADLASLAADVPERLSTFPIWPPLAIMNDIWAAGGTGAARLAVMNRATCPKTAILGRAADRAAGTLYIGVDGPIAMAHALYVTAGQRRRGLARNLLRAAARWASEAGAARLVLAVESDNVPAVCLYRAMGMTPAAHYHYRER